MSQVATSAQVARKDRGICQNTLLIVSKQLLIQATSAILTELSVGMRFTDLLPTDSLSELRLT